MSPAPRRRGTAGAPIRSRRRLGEIRRAQLVTTYGVGAMIAVDNESFIIRGINSWDTSVDAPVLTEPRLSVPLGVKHFRLPPAPDQDRAHDGVRAYRFPQMYSCPKCNELQAYTKFNAPRGKAECGTCQEGLVPSRFVMACPAGHLEDFPYWKWVHRGTQRATTDACGGTLTFEAGGSTASLRSVLVGCSCGAAKVSMEGSFSKAALRELGIRCGGLRPWLKGAPVVACGEAPRALQRGSSSVWFPVMHSALSIPPYSEGLMKVALPYLDRLADRDPGTIRTYLDIEGVLDHYPAYSSEDFIGCIANLRALRDQAKGTAVDPTDGAPAATNAREAIYHDEYDSLSRTHPEDPEAGKQDFVCEPPHGNTAETMALGLDQVMLVKKLREVRALQSFTRVEEPAGDTARHAAISLDKPDWLPAIEVSGEGVFLRLDEQRLSTWEQQPKLVERAQRIRAHHEQLLQDRAAGTGRIVPSSPVTPRFLLLHGLAHILINEWSLDGGYPAGALRERIYAGHDMAGILLYTATSDSAGSLGGIVAQGDPTRLAAGLRAALSRAEWCSNDPLCMESEASGADALNLAACHACVLLPETSCEYLNSFLDRAALIGTPDGSVPSYFTTT